MQKLAIIGPNASQCSGELYAFGVELGRRLAAPGRVIVCGGLGGFMEAVCRGAKGSEHTFAGQTVGILPGETAEAAKPYIDVAIPTGTGVARNLILIRTADIIVAAGGGAGTLSEIAFAWQLGKKVLCVTRFGGWAKELAGRDLDERFTGLLVAVESIEEILENLAKGEVSSQ